MQGHFATTQFKLLFRNCGILKLMRSVSTMRGIGIFLKMALQKLYMNYVIDRNIENRIQKQRITGLKDFFARDSEPFYQRYFRLGCWVWQN